MQPQTCFRSIWANTCQYVFNKRAEGLLLVSLSTNRKRAPTRPKHNLIVPFRKLTSCVDWPNQSELLMVVQCSPRAFSSLSINTFGFVLQKWSEFPKGIGHVIKTNKGVLLHPERELSFDSFQGNQKDNPCGTLLFFVLFLIENKRGQPQHFWAEALIVSGPTSKSRKRILNILKSTRGFISWLLLTPLQKV